MRVLGEVNVSRCSKLNYKIAAAAAAAAVTAAAAAVAAGSPWLKTEWCYICEAEFREVPLLALACSTYFILGYCDRVEY